MTKDGVVLVPLDGTSLSEGALPHACALATALKVPIRLLHIQHSQEDTNSTLATTAARGSGATGRGESGKYLEMVAAKLGARGIRASTVIEQGEPQEAICCAAERPEVILVVMATHGRGGVERWIEGSVADAVMRTTTKPTLLFVPSDRPGWRSEVGLRRIMVPLDGLPTAEAALPLAGQIAAGSGAMLTLVKALSRMGAPGTFVPNLDQWEAEEIEAAKAYLETIRSRLPASVTSEALVLVGHSPASLLSRFAGRENVDLVIMSTRGHGGFRRLTLGSVADRLVRSGAPALLVRLPVVNSPIANGTSLEMKPRNVHG